MQWLMHTKYIYKDALMDNQHPSMIVDKKQNSRGLENQLSEQKSMVKQSNPSDFSTGLSILKGQHKVEFTNLTNQTTYLFGSFQLVSVCLDCINLYNRSNAACKFCINICVLLFLSYMMY